MIQSNLQVGSSQSTILTRDTLNARRFGYGVFNYPSSAGAVTITCMGNIGTQSIQLKTESINPNASGGGVVDCEGYESISILATGPATIDIDYNASAEI